MNSQTMHPTSPLKHPPPPSASGAQPYPYQYHLSLTSINAINGDDSDDDSQLTHTPITSFTVADPQAPISRMSSATTSAASASSRKGKMLDKFGSLSKKVVKQVLGGTGNNPPQNRMDLIPTFGRGGAARPKVRVYGATPMPLPATKRLSAIGAFDASSLPPDIAAAVQVDTTAAAGSSASSGVFPTSSSPGPPSARSTNTDALFLFARPSPVPSNGGSSVRPHSDHPFAVASPGRGAVSLDIGRSEGRYDPRDGDDDDPSFPAAAHPARVIPPGLGPRMPTNFISMFTPSRSPSRERSLSPVPSVPLKTKPRVRSASHPPPMIVRDDFDFLNHPPGQAGEGSGPASRRLGRRTSVATSSNSYTTARSKSRPRTTITTTTRSFRRRPPPLHLELGADQVYYPRPQRPEQQAYGSGLLDRDEDVERSGTPAGIVSEWREGEGGERKMMYRLSSPMMEFPPTPSSGSFELGSGSNTAMGRSRTVTPGTIGHAPSEAGERGRPRVRGPRRLVSVPGSVQETFGVRVTPNLPLPAPSEPNVLPDQHHVDAEVGQPRRRRPLPSPPAPSRGLPPLSIAPAQYVPLPTHRRSNHTSNANSSSGSLSLLRGTSASHASTHSRTSLSGRSETTHSDAASSSIAGANAVLIRNALKLLAGGAPSVPPPLPPTVPRLQQPSSTASLPTVLPTVGVPPTSVLGLGLPISPYVLPQAQPQLVYGPMSPVFGGLGTGVSLPAIPVPVQPVLPMLMQPQQPFSPQLAMPGLLPLSPPVQQQPLGVGFGSPPMTGAMEVLIALANQNLRLMAAVEQQRLERQQLQQQQNVEVGAADLRRERSAPAPSSATNPGEALGLQTATDRLQPSPPSSRRRTRTSMLSTSTAPSNFTTTTSSSSSTSSSPNSSQSKRTHSQQTPTPPVSPRASSTHPAPSSPARPSSKARISTPKLGRPFRISLSTVLGGEGSSTRGLAAPAEEVPPPVPPLPASLGPRAQQPGTLIDTRPSTALSDYEADDEERKRERPHSWLAELRGWEELVLGDLVEESEVPSSSSAARAMAEMGELNSPGLFSVSTGTTAAETSFSGTTRENTFDDEGGSEGFGKVPFPRSRSRPRELGFASAGLAMRMGSRGRTLSALSRVGLEIFEKEGRVRDSIDSMDSMDSMDSTASSNGGAMDLEELSIMTAHVFT